MGFPDYENGYSVSSDFIANKNGWLYSSATGRWTVLINGHPVRQQVIHPDQINGAIAPISSGDKVKIIMTQGDSYLCQTIFYPCKQLAASQGGGGSSGPAPAVDWEHGQTLSSGSAVPEDGVVKSGTFSAYFDYAETLTSYTNLVINGVQVKSGGRIAFYAHGGVKPNEYIHPSDPSPTAHFYVKKGDVVISYGSADSNLKGNPHGTIYGNYKFYPLRKK